jgi:DNA-binding NtrC family response regulator
LRLGGTSTITADVRIVAATNRDLEAAIANKSFREDLYYRLNVLEIVLPPLRERASDIEDIADAIAARLGGEEAPALPLSSGARLELAQADWPGNVRQLENTIARGWATALGEGAFAIEARHLFGKPKAAEASKAEATSPSAVGDFQLKTREFQAQLVEAALRETEWNVSEAARRLSLSRSRLNELIRAFGLSREERPSR